MSEARRTEVEGRSAAGGGPWRDGRARRWIVYAALLLLAFLLGLVPMWLRARERGRELEAARRELRVSRAQNALANAAVDARRGEYEPARRAASEFFTRLRDEMERGPDSAFTRDQVNGLRPLFDARDDTITLLARGDPASAERLAELYNSYRQAAGGAGPR
jgi:hypothetical protein